MPRKQKSKRRSAQEVLLTFTRENVLGYMEERDKLAEEARGIDTFVAKLRSYNVSDADIAEARSKMTSGNMARLSYIETNVRRAALAITRAAGYSHWTDIIKNNLEMLPSVEDKKTLSDLPF